MALIDEIMALQATQDRQGGNGPVFRTRRPRDQQYGNRGNLVTNSLLNTFRAESSANRVARSLGTSSVETAKGLEPFGATSTANATAVSRILSPILRRQTPTAGEIGGASPELLDTILKFGLATQEGRTARDVARTTGEAETSRALQTQELENQGGVQKALIESLLGTGEDPAKILIQLTNMLEKLGVGSKKPVATGNNAGTGKKKRLSETDIANRFSGQ